VSHPIAAVAPAVGLASWSFEPAVTVPALAAAALYWRGFTMVSLRMPERFDVWRAVAFFAGLATLVLALCSPLDPLGHSLLQAHMIQHLLLMMVVPPLIWLGAPVAPVLLGLPRPLRRAVARGLAARPVRRLTAVVGHPAFGLVAFSVAFWFWHLPALYDLALGSDAWHHVEHVCFLATALLYWRPVILAWPARSPWPRWTMIPYLVLGEFQNTALSAILAFSDRVIYPAYEAAPRLWGVSALEDQSIAGAIMWVPGSLAFLLPVLWLVLTAVAGTQDAPRIPAQPALRRR
jgi:cytochrome c oxidase assembly factor CtaG